MCRKLLIILLFIPCFPGITLAQENKEEVNILFQRLRQAASNTARVDILNDLAYYYMHGLQLPHRELDSALLYGKQALALSKKTGYQKGYWVALDRTFDAYAIAGNITQAFGVIENIYDTHVVRTLFSYGIVYQGSIWRKPDRDSALIFYRKALAISEKTGNEYFICNSKLRIISCYAMMGDTAQVIRELKAFEHDSKPPYVAEAWHIVGHDVGHNTGYLSFALAAYQRALDMYQALGDKTHAGEVLLNMGGLYDEHGNPAKAEQYYLEAAALQQQAQYPQIHKTYLRLHDLYYYRGDLDKAVHYSLEAAKSAEKYGISNFTQFFRYDDNPSNGSGQVEKNNYNTTTLLKAAVKEKIREGKATEALNLALVEIGRASHFGDLTNMIHAEVLGICYTALRRYDEAERHYLQMKQYAANLNEQFAALAPYSIGKFYFETGQYAKAAPYLQQYLQFPYQSTAITGIGEAHLLLYRIDSARHDYASALQHFRAYKTITDSVFSATKSRQIAELKVQYDIEKKDQVLQLQQKDIELLTKQKLLQQSLAEQKEQDVLLKQQNIDLLKQQQSMQEMITNRQQRELERKEKELHLQQDNIALLHHKEQLQGAQLKQAHFIKRMTIAGIVLLLIIVALLYNQYHTKLRSNRKISEQNDKLHQLLEEKEWLLKEVHHRVKNNLQVVLSLLQSQSIYLKDEALAAVNDSQHRVQAMSLIHQKLYQSDNISTINMNTYIPELVEYLKDSFVTPTRIVFILDVAPVALEVSQAVPLGLIINEAVTNIFKHAFTGRERGQVNISLRQLDEAELVLTIADNGIGLPAHTSDISRNSLGLSLMKGLCRDFNGRYSIESREGTRIQVTFNRHIYNPDSNKQPITGHPA